MITCHFPIWHSYTLSLSHMAQSLMAKMDVFGYSALVKIEIGESIVNGLNQNSLI